VETRDKINLAIALFIVLAAIQQAFKAYIVGPDDPTYYHRIILFWTMIAVSHLQLHRN